MKNKERKGSHFGLMLSSLVLISGASYAPQSGQPIPQLSVENRPSNTQPASDNRQWRSATYRGLKVGKSTRKDMLRVLGKPKISVVTQARITTNPNTIISFHYGGPNGYAGDLIVGIEKTTNIIVWIETSPANLSRDDVIRQFGNNYILTGYELDDCFIDGQPRTLYETSPEAVNPTDTQMEYRSIGIAVQFRLNQEVYRIIYISDKWPYGNTSSFCNKPRKGLAYIACGCGCCGGFQPRQCIYQSKGDDLQQVVSRDKDAAKNPNCAQAGCGIGTKYVYCD